MRIEYETRGLIRFREMRIHFGMILSVLMKQRINENMGWTDSQDYGADEILYTARTVLFDKINRLMREITILFGVSPQMFLPTRRYGRSDSSMSRRSTVPSTAVATSIPGGVPTAR